MQASLDRARRPVRTALNVASHRVAFAAYIAVWGCGGSTDPDPVTSISTVSVTAASASAVPGETVQLSAEARDAQGRIVTGQQLEWRSSDDSRATITPTGLLTARAPGPITITATAREIAGTLQFRVDDGAFITPAGGTFRALSFVDLVVPAGAVATPVALRITTATNPLVDPEWVAPIAATLSPSNTRFTQPVTLRLAYDGARQPLGLPETELAVHSLSGSTWSVVAGSTPSTATRSVEATITGGGTFAVRRRNGASGCTAPESRQFDFRVGTWSWVLSVGPTGSAEIVSESSGCAIHETLRIGTSTVIGSLTYFDVATNRWVYTSVDNGGNPRSVFTGGLVGDAMILTDATSASRIVWERLDADRVRQSGETSVDAGKTWTRGPSGLYTRQR